MKVLNAVKWSDSRDVRSGERYWDILTARANGAYYDRAKKTIMRNQLHLGFDNSLWPTLSRLLIMGKPELAEKIHPRKSELDSEEGIALLNTAYISITGRKPVINDWRLAK